MSVQRSYYKSRAEWIELRGEMAKNLKIGASDIATALGLNKYKSPIQLFYNILGIYESKFESLRMSLGLLEEAVNKSCYEGYCADEMDFAVNVKDGIKANKVRLVNYIAISSDYPIIAASLDFERPKNQPALVASEMFAAGEIIPFSYPIDAKNTNEQYHKKWPKASGMPESYKCQLHGQMIATETKYSELSVKVDSSMYKIIPCPYDEKYGTWLKQELLVFYKRLVQAYPLATLLLEARAQGDVDSEALYTSLIAQLEPPLVGTEEEIEFLNSFYGMTSDNTLAGDETHEALAKAYSEAHKRMKSAEDEKLFLKSQAVHVMAGKIENITGENYKITHRINAKGREYFSIKFSGEEEDGDD